MTGPCALNTDNIYNEEVFAVLGTVKSVVHESTVRFKKMYVIKLCKHVVLLQSLFFLREY